MWLRLEELGLVRRWSITLSRKPDTGRYGLGLNEGNEVTVAPEGSGLMLADIIIGCEGERLGVKRLEDHLLHHGEPRIELEVRPRPRSPASPPYLHSTMPPRAEVVPAPLAGDPRAVPDGGAAPPRLLALQRAARAAAHRGRVLAGHRGGGEEVAAHADTLGLGLGAGLRLGRGLGWRLICGLAC